jgi:prepilin-type N-terminal cleavage/methylation domain-containing protein
LARREAGYTLVELVVVTALFAVVMGVISVSFGRIVGSSSQINKSVETEIGGLIGLELFRLDLGLAGLGLPWTIPAAVSYDEAPHYNPVSGGSALYPGADAFLYNDTSPGASLPPRAVVLGDSVGYNGSDYLVLKGTPLGMSSSCRSWSFLSYSSNSTLIKPSKSEIELQPGNHTRVIVLRTGVAGGMPARELVNDGSGFTLYFDEPLAAQYAPRSREDSYVVYGVANAGKVIANKDGSKTQAPLDFPFNRSDYYLSRPDDISDNCAPGTAVLYKTTLNQNDSWTTQLSDRFTSYPLLDCVADMQVLFLLDTNGDGEADLHTNDLSGYSAQAIREQVKEIRVYLLAQQGKKDRAFFYPASRIVVGDPKFPAMGGVWDEARLKATFKDDWMHYHWKLYTIAVQPKNLD